MASITRRTLIGGVTHDEGALPCPRCRSVNLAQRSHPAVGPRVACLDCGAEACRVEWNDGLIRPTQHTRPASDVIVMAEKEVPRG